MICNAKTLRVYLLYKLSPETNIEMDSSFNFYLSDFNNEEDFEYHDNEADFEYHDNETDFEYHDNETDFEYRDNDKDEDLDPNRVLEEENEEEDALITLPSRTKRISKV